MLKSGVNDPRAEVRPALKARLSAVLCLWLMVTSSMLWSGMPLAAMETDQFYAWRAPLADVSEPLNAFVNDRIDAVLERLDRKTGGEVTCSGLTVAVLRDLHVNPFAAPVRTFLEKNEAVDRSPQELGNFAYFKVSIFRRPAWPFYLPLASTVNIGGVLVGLDKFAHLFGSGRRYYRRYRAALQDGESEQDAMRRAILYGVKMENWFQGKKADGVFSYADLEANFQGLRLAIDICGGDSPHIVRHGSSWRLERPVDLRGYINPGFDESYNNNLYSPYRWKKVRRILERDYCPIYMSDSVQSLHAGYRQIDRANFSTEVIREFMEAKGETPQKEHSMREICRAYLPIDLSLTPNVRR